MTRGLVRRQQKGDLHFVTFSCYQRRAYFALPKSRSLFEDALERMRVRYGFFVVGYVVMPEHVHLLMSEPETGLLADALKALKLSVALRRQERPFWSARYYDFNVFIEKKRIEKLKYIHRNPVTRGWWLRLRIGPGRAFFTMLLECRERLRLSRSGRLTEEVVLLREPTSQKRDVGHPDWWRAKKQRQSLSSAVVCFCA